MTGLTILLAALLSVPAASAMAEAEIESVIAPEQVCSGVWKFSYGISGEFTPEKTRTIKPDYDGIADMETVGTCPRFPYFIQTERGTEIHIPLSETECLYGLGLQMKSFQLRGSKKTLRVNADPETAAGDSHAPVPFYVSTEGYGIYVDCAGYISFYFDSARKKDDPCCHEVIVDIPGAEGADVLVFGGPDMKGAISRYNLYSGGGIIPPRWGLGFWYRVNLDFSQQEVLQTAMDLRERNIPCDVIGLEPGWQTASYSCSYVWDNKFEAPEAMIRELAENGFRINLWKHAFISHESPLYGKLRDCSCDYEVWNGLVPDFLLTEARKIYSDYLQKELVSIGVSGFKGDECDNSDYTGNWSFPEFSRFPSGIDGEQMHSIFGLRYQDAMLQAFADEGVRTYGLIRNTGAFAAPYPFVLYSDLYDHGDFIRSMAVSGFSGLLWTPEVRHAENSRDLIRRLQSTVLSPLAMINAWYLENFPWKQTDRELNNSGIYFEDWIEVEAICRKIIGIRMQLVPYLHSAFVKYAQEGLPPFRALVVDYPDDPAVHNLPGQYMIGDRMMAAPLTSAGDTAEIYFPEGEWIDFNTGERFSGNAFHEIYMPLDHLPLFVMDNSVIPLAELTQSTADENSMNLSVRVYGEKPEPFVLYDDDGTVSPSLDRTVLTAIDGEMTVRKDNDTSRYTVKEVLFL